MPANPEKQIKKLVQMVPPRCGNLLRIREKEKENAAK